MKLITQPDAGVTPVVQAIRRAKRSVHICIFRFDLPEVEKALAASVQHGVVVRALIAHTNRGGEGRLRKLEKRLLDAGVIRVLGRLKGPEGEVVVRPLKGLRLHVRAIVRDGTRAFVGSQSLRKMELDKRREVGVLISNPTVTRKLLEVFDADWDASATKADRKEEKQEQAVA